MKKLSKLLTALLIACLMLAGCGTDEKKTDKDGTAGEAPAQDV